MKKFFPALAMTLLACASCGSNPEDTEQNQPVTTTEAPAINTRLISTGGAGIFRIGDPVPASSDSLSIQKETRARTTEEGPISETVFSVRRQGRELLNFLPADEITGNPTIGEIQIASEAFKTAEGIGVGSTLQDFTERYPEHQFWYTYVSDMYVAEHPSGRLQFILDPQSVIRKPQVSSEQSPMQASDFKPGARIQKVRILP
jgi:hypothetical protein